MYCLENDKPHFGVQRDSIQEGPLTSNTNEGTAMGCTGLTATPTTHPSARVASQGDRVRGLYEAVVRIIAVTSRL